MMSLTLTDLCQALNNWFERERFSGSYEIRDGDISVPFLREGQYYRIIGSLFNDGIHRYGDYDLTEETFDGDVWSLAIPSVVVRLAEDIDAWREKYENVESAAMSPFMSEQVPNYSYSKGSSFSGTDSGGSTNWQTFFAGRLARWKKI